MPPPVVPHAGAWIETYLTMPRPTRDTVAPHAGAWIETTLLETGCNAEWVAPHAGAWIETSFALTTPVHNDSSRPTRARGLKLIDLAPNHIGNSRAPRGRVD